ncbi:hypothetical protein G6F43_000137 [Rhizopus delemar]|nr:hypothetical protein G6F43_000137 [Rhizopus delemar]
MSKEYSLKDLYNEQSEEEDSDFVLEENEESEGSDIEESETEEESTATVTKKRSLEETEDPLKKKAKMDAIWKEMNNTKPTQEKGQERPSIKESVVKEEPERKETTSKINRPKSILSSLVSQYDIKIPKMNTLEKSKLDWQKFVEKEDIQDDLKYKNKDGYMEKVEFLQRVDDRRLQQLKTGQKAMVFDGVSVCGDSDPCRARSQCSFYKRVECCFIKHRKVGGYLPIIVSREDDHSVDRTDG